MWNVTPRKFNARVNWRAGAFILILCGTSCAIDKTGGVNIVFVHGIPTKMRGVTKIKKIGG